MLAGVSRDANTPSSSRFHANSPLTILANLATSLPIPVQCPYFKFLFWVSVRSRVWLPSGDVLVLRPRVVAGLDEESSVETCGKDVGDVLAVELEEPVDNPGTKIDRHVVFRAALYSSAISNEIRFLATGPLIGISVIFAVFSKR